MQGGEASIIGVERFLAPLSVTKETEKRRRLRKVSKGPSDIFTGRNLENAIEKKRSDPQKAESQEVLHNIKCRPK